MSAPISTAMAQSKRIDAIRSGEEEVVVDGRLAEDIWARARFVEDFRQKMPVEGGMPTDRTQIAVAYDENALYVAARMHASDLGMIRSTMTRRDNSGSSERIIVALDPYRNRRTAYSFSITAAGVRTDYYHRGDTEFDRDYSFDAVWEGDATIDSAGWSAEFRIPFSQLRFNDHPRQVWGVNINRFIPDRNEDLYWVMIPRSESGWASRFGELHGLDGIRSTASVELLPYVAFRAIPEEPRPFSAGGAFRGGLDARLGIGSVLTLNGAINPDFGQIEADPSSINLTAFETFYEERRPLFVHGSGFFNAQGPRYFYSRRIGAPPRVPVSERSAEPYPQSTAILGAMRLTGRTYEGLSIGALAAVTGSERLSVFDSIAHPVERRIQPVTGYGVVRLGQEIGDGGTLGLIATSVVREGGEGDPDMAVLSRSAFAASLDCDLRPWGREYAVSAHLGGSLVLGSTDAITRLQKSSTRYFQRPDATAARLDTSRTSFVGYTAGLSIERLEGDHWLWSAFVSAESPGLELNDLGSLSSADDIDAGGEVIYRETTPGSWFREYSVSIGPYAGLNFEGARLYSGVSASYQVTLPNFWTSSITLYYDGPGQSDNLTRGGPLMATPSGGGFAIYVDNGFSNRTSWSMRTAAGGNSAQGYYWRIGGSVGTIVADRIDLAVEVTGDRQVDARQYLMDVADGGEATFGRRYVFSTSDLRTLRLGLRAAYAITPDLSIEGYAEAFSGGVGYHGIGELARAGSGEIIDYAASGIARVEHNRFSGFTVAPVGGDEFEAAASDFVSSSLRTNIVVRWEPLVGTTAYLVFQQNRFVLANGRSTSVARDLFAALADGYGQSIVALKISYWIPI